MASLSLRNVYKRYPGGVTAVSDFNLEIKDKEFIILPDAENPPRFVWSRDSRKSPTARFISVTSL